MVLYLFFSQEKHSHSPLFDSDIRSTIGADTYPVIQEYIVRGDVFQETIETFLRNEEHKHLRKMLKLALGILDNEEGTYIVEDTSVSEMPFYFDHIRSMVNGHVTGRDRRRHSKRSSFDSISHHGGLGGLGGTHRRRKLEFTFENLLPYLLDQMRRNSRDVPDTDY